MPHSQPATRLRKDAGRDQLSQEAGKRGIAREMVEGRAGGGHGVRGTGLVVGAVSGKRRVLGQRGALLGQS